MDQNEPDHWAYHMRRCPLVGCNGVVDDELETPCCCACGNELRDGPGCMALPSPSGRRFQNDPCPGHTEDAFPPRPENVVSLDVCVSCGARETAIDMGPHRFVLEHEGRKHIEQLTYPAFHCHACGERWRDHRGEQIRDEAHRRVLAECPR